MFRRARAIHQSALIAILGALVVALIVIVPVAGSEPIRGSATYRPEVVGKVGVVAAGRHFAAEAGMRMLARGGNAVDAGVAATFAAAVTEISHFGLGGEVPIVLYLADRKDAVVINGQGTAPAAASADIFRAVRGIPTNGPSAGTVPAVVDALAIALAEFGTLSLADVLAPAIASSRRPGGCSRRGTAASKSRRPASGARGRSCCRRWRCSTASSSSAWDTTRPSTSTR